MLKLICLLFILTQQLFAINDSECSKLRNTGFFGPYKYNGLGKQSAIFISTEQGTFKATTGYSTETTTASFDPYFWVNNTTVSPSQYASSTGGCAMFTIQNRKEILEQYIAFHHDEVMKEVAQGSGEHLKVLSYYSFCSDKNLSAFERKLQENYSKFNDPSISFVQNLDKIILDDSNLKNDCEISKYLLI